MRQFLLAVMVWFDSNGVRSVRRVTGFSCAGTPLERVMLTHELVQHLFGESPHPLRERMERWFVASRRYAAFVEANAPKIRKKLHVRTDPDSLADLQLELETAFCLLTEGAFALAYEPGVEGKRAGPDFAVTYTSSQRFLLEVTRTHVRDRTASTHEAAADRLVDVAGGKLRQMAPSVVNVLLIGARLDEAIAGQLPDALNRLLRRVERGESAVLARYGFASRSVFFAHFQRLSQLVVRDPDDVTSEYFATWANPQARQALPARVRTALLRSLRQAGPG